MKKIVLLISLAIAFISCNSDNLKSDTDKDTKKTVAKKCDLTMLFVISPVKELTIESYSAFVHETDTTYVLENGAVYKYNSEGNCTFYGSFGGVPGHFYSQQRFIYNKDGMLIKTEYYNSGDSLVSYSENTIVDGENKLLKTFYDANGTIQSKSDLFTDKDGFVIKEVSDVLLKEFIFDEENRLKESVFITGPIDSRFVYEYKDLDFPVKTLVYNSENKLKSETTHEYILDKQGNYIQKNNFENGVLISVEKRKIVY
jgi:hypothetical protein